MQSLRGKKRTPCEGAGRLPVFLLDLGPPPYQLPVFARQERLPAMGKGGEDDVDAADTATSDKGSTQSSTFGWALSVRSDGRLGSDGQRCGGGRLDAPGVARRPL